MHCNNITRRYSAQNRDIYFFFHHERNDSSHLFEIYSDKKQKKKTPQTIHLERRAQQPAARYSFIKYVLIK